jgi:hypothetical protein
MPLATINLVSLKQSSSIAAFLQALKATSLKVLVVSKVVRWVITPEQINAKELLYPRKPWDLLVITLDKTPLPSSLNSNIECHWSTVAGVPSRLTNEFASQNDGLLHPKSTRPLTGALDQPRIGSTSQTLELSPGLQDWIKSFSQTHTGRNAMSMLNLLAFLPDKHESYLTYGKAFAESIGSKRGGNAKIVGKVVPKQGTDGEDSAGWDEIALAHYPSINHFIDMLASDDYQEVNHKHRLPALFDTCILCTSELDPRLGKEKARL